MAAIDDAAARNRDAIARRDRDATRRLLAVYEDVQRSVLRDLTELGTRIAELQAQGIDVSRGMLEQDAAYRRLLTNARREYTRLAQATGQLTELGVEWAAQAAVAAAEQLVAIEAGAGFGGLNTSAIESIVGTTLDAASPLRPILEQMVDDAVTGLADAAANDLIQGVARGRNPRQIARQLAARGAPVQRARTVARTEMLRAYRQSTLAVFDEHADVVTAWEWRSARSDRTCRACWAMDGTRFNTKAPMGTHPNCRCVMLPVTASSRRRPTGPQVFSRLPPARQREILGPAAHRAYVDGALDLGDLVRERETRRWGVTRSVGSLADAVGAQAAARYRTPA